MNGLDFVIIIILVASVIYSLFRGLVREVFSLLSIVLGFIAASRWYPFLAGFFLPWITSNAIANILGFILTFIAVSIIISLIGKLVRRFVSFIKLESINRLLGAAFGLLKGVFVVIVLILILIAFLPPAHPVLTKSRLSPYFMTLGEISISMIPVNLRQTVRQKKEDLSPYWKRLSSNQSNSGEEEGGTGETMNP